MSRYLPGDVVSRRKGPVMHRGVVLGDGRVLHNTPGRGEHISSFESFSAGRKVRVQRRTLAQRDAALARAARWRARPYHLLRNNCEHTVSRARDGREASPQLAEYALGGMDENLFVSSYQTALPDAEELKRFLNDEARRLGMGGES